MDYFLVKNLYNYEKVISPPENLTKRLKTVYVTDSLENEKKAKDLGWDIVKCVDIFKNAKDPFNRRKSVAFINSYPAKIVPEIKNSNFIFVCDSNIVKMWNKYEDFVNNCTNDKALFIISGWYSGERDNIITECRQSCAVKRWSYNHKEIADNTSKYEKEFAKKNIDVKKVSIVSAKYIGWNINHPSYEFLSNKLYEECCKHLQGNIALTFMSAMYSKDIYNYYNTDYSGGILNKHNFPA